jgi:hypothetical protein
MNDTPPLAGKDMRRIAWKNARGWLVIAGAQIVATFLLAFAMKRGLIDAETMMRGVMVVIGLGLAVTGNRIPKTTDGLAPHTLELATLRQKVLRAAGWMLMLGGLGFAVLWAFAPLGVAQVAATVALGGSMAVGLGFVAWWIHAYHRAPPQ